MSSLRRAKVDQIGAHRDNSSSIYARARRKHPPENQSQKTPHPLIFESLLAYRKNVKNFKSILNSTQQLAESSANKSPIVHASNRLKNPNTNQHDPTHNREQKNQHY